MFLRRHRRAKDGKEHAYWSLVETLRTPDGPRQRRLCYLGELHDSARARWLRTIEVINGQGESRQLKVFPSGVEPPEDGPAVARVLRANAQAALENVSLWHERHISHSSVERVILPDSTILADYLLDRTRRIIEQLLVYPDRMRQNLEMTKGLVFSGQLLLDLAAKGVLREEAYKWVQRNAMKAWEEGSDFRKLVAADPDISRTLSPTELAAAFDLQRQLRHVDAIFARVFGS